MGRKVAVLPCVAVVLGLATPTSAAADTDTEGDVSHEGSPAPVDPEASTTFRPVTPRDRNGVVLEVLTLGGAYSGFGYPNSATKFGDPRFHAASGALAGTDLMFVLGGALTDTFTFAFWGATESAANSQWRSTAFGGGIRLEAFPLYGVREWLDGLGVALQFGVGSAKLESKGGLSGADGAQSFLLAGAFYEWRIVRVLGGHLAAGPALDGQAVLSQPFDRVGGELGLRVTFYGGT